jgi:uncharacterized protein (TIGR02246 family)
MRRFAALLSVLVIALMATACNQPADTHDADVKAVKNNEAQWNQDWQSKDPDKIAAHYAGDGVLIVSGMPPTVGKDAILSAIKQMVADPAISLTFQASTVEVAKSGDLAYTQGSYKLTLTDPRTKKPINDHGSYVTVYRKNPGGLWRAVSDVAVSEVPPPAPPAARQGKSAARQPKPAARHARAKRH